VNVQSGKRGTGVDHKFENITAKIKEVQQFWYEVKTGKNLERKPACEDIMGQIRANKQVATLFEELSLSTKGTHAKSVAPKRSISFTLLFSLGALTKYEKSPTTQMRSLLRDNPLDLEVTAIVRDTRDLLQQITREDNDESVRTKDDARSWIIDDSNPICSETASNPSNTHACAHTRIHEHITHPHITRTRTHFCAVSSSTCDFLYACEQDSGRCTDFF